MRRERMVITDLGGFEDFLHGKKDTRKGCVIIKPNGEIIVPDPEEYRELAGEEPGKREETAPDSGDGRQGDPSASSHVKQTRHRRKNGT